MAEEKQPEYTFSWDISKCYFEGDIRFLLTTHLKQGDGTVAKSSWELWCSKHGSIKDFEQFATGKIDQICFVPLMRQCKTRRDPWDENFDVLVARDPGTGKVRLSREPDDAMEPDSADQEFWFPDAEFSAKALAAIRSQGDLVM